MWWRRVSDFDLMSYEQNIKGVATEIHNTSLQWQWQWQRNRDVRQWMNCDMLTTTTVSARLIVETHKRVARILWWLGLSQTIIIYYSDNTATQYFYANVCLPWSWLCIEMFDILIVQYLHPTHSFLLNYWNYIYCTWMLCWARGPYTNGT